MSAFIGRRWSTMAINFSATPPGPRSNIGDGDGAGGEEAMNDTTVWPRWTIEQEQRLVSRSRQNTAAISNSATSDKLLSQTAASTVGHATRQRHAEHERRVACCLLGVRALSTTGLGSSCASWSVLAQLVVRTAVGPAAALAVATIHLT